MDGDNEDARNSQGQFINDDLGLGASESRQRDAGVDIFDSRQSAQDKVFRYNLGMATGPQPTSVSSDAVVDLVKIALLVVAVLWGLPLLFIFLSDVAWPRVYIHALWKFGVMGIIGIPIIIALLIRRRKAVFTMKPISKLIAIVVGWMVLRSMSMLLAPFIDLAFIFIFGYTVYRCKPSAPTARQ